MKQQPRKLGDSLKQQSIWRDDSIRQVVETVRVQNSGTNAKPNMSPLPGTDEREFGIVDDLDEPNYDSIRFITLGSGFASGASSTPADTSDSSFNGWHNLASESTGGRRSHEASERRLDCSICTASINQMQALNCGHVICSDCVRQIRASTNRCPMCKGRITSAKDIFL